jgi:hypothetical protein
MEAPMDDQKLNTVLQEMSGLLVSLAQLKGKLAASHPELAQDVQSTQKLAHSVDVMLKLHRTNQ